MCRDAGYCQRDEVVKMLAIIVMPVIVAMLHILILLFDGNA